MVITTFVTLEIGRRYDVNDNGAIYLRHDNPTPYTQPFIVIREATREEWRDFCIEMHGELSPAEPDSTAKFYLISTD